MHFKSTTTLLAALAACGALLAGAFAGEQSAVASSNEPNVILILTDDQTLDEMRALPKTQALIGGAGVTFSRAYISYPLCCPSRVSMLSGQYMHNHDVRGNQLPSGGWGKFATNGTEEKALPTWLQTAGYYNVEVGKYMNGYV
ncbi:MAG: sulfatase-like hydrolase/transferase, partial [Solirubrobacterales bacterium]|nr:sulfatase-like hydrolase/transferase [Solirubrobacterales bacterium]